MSRLSPYLHHPDTVQINGKRTSQIFFYIPYFSVPIIHIHSVTSLLLGLYWLHYICSRLSFAPDHKSSPTQWLCPPHCLGLHKSFRRHQTPFPDLQDVHIRRTGLLPQLVSWLFIFEDTSNNDVHIPTQPFLPYPAFFPYPAFPFSPSGFTI